jgi:hypothetical protein
MKRAAVVLIAVLFALPLAADDSPLVHAAKANKKKSTKAKAGKVITNDTLLKSGGHVTTTTPATQTPLPPVAPAAAEAPKTATAEDAKAKASAAKVAKKQKEMRDRAMAQAAAGNEGDIPETLYEDPAVTEAHQEKVAAEKAPEPKPVPTTTAAASPKPPA